MHTRIDFQNKENGEIILHVKYQHFSKKNNRVKILTTKKLEISKISVLVYPVYR